MPYQNIEIPLFGGLNTKVDERVVQPPTLLRADNALFTELGSTRKRHPSTVLAGTAPTDLRKLVVYDDELIAFSKDKLYTYSQVDDDWVEKATYLAPKVTEQSVFTRTTEQIACDRCELNGVVLYAWEDKGDEVYAAAVDKETGAVLAGPTAQGVSTTRPRLVAVTSTKALLLLHNGTSVAAKDIDTASQAAIDTDLSASSSNLFAGSGGPYDAVVVGSSAHVVTFDTVAAAVGWVIVDDTGSTTSSGSTGRTGSSTEPIALAVTADEANLALIRVNSTTLKADILDSAMADTANVDISVGSISSGSFDQVAAAFRSTQDSNEYRCYVFWSANEADDGTNFTSELNWVDTGGSTGTEATFIPWLGVASRAFDHDGSVYTWMTFAGENTVSGVSDFVGGAVQNGYFLYRDDGTLVAKAVTQVAGGFSQRTGHLPNVQSLGSNQYAWCGVERRKIPLGGQSGQDYSARGPREVVFEFDSDEARRVARLGRTLYLSGGQILQYDGEGLTEVGFHVFPWAIEWLESASASISKGSRTFKGTYRWDNAKGERDRSTTALLATLPLSVDDAEYRIDCVPLTVTLKQSPRTDAAIEWWRTVVDPPLGAPFYLVTDQDPTNDSGDNRYVENDPTSTSKLQIIDDLTDDEIIALETNPENGGVLGNVAPPPATIIAADENRIYLAGIADDPHQVRYSKLRGASEVVAFNDGLYVQLPRKGGAVTAIEFLNETPVVFKENAIYRLSGAGLNNLGQGGNFLSELIATDVGAKSAEVVAVTPDGLFFLSEKGWYLLDRGWNVQYVGAAVSDFDSDEFVSVVVMEDSHQIRCLSSSRLLVYDFVAKHWSSWSISNAIDAVLWDGTYTYGDSTDAVYTEDSSAGGGHQLDVESAWIKPAGLQGYQRTKYIELMAEYRSAHDLRVRISYDYDDSVVDDFTITPQQSTVGGLIQERFRLSRPKAQAFKVRITDQAVGSTSAPAGEGVRLIALTLRTRLKEGVNKHSEAQKH